MLPHPPSASDADGDLLSQLSSALSDLDSDTHRASALVVLCQLCAIPVTSPKARKNIDFCCATKSRRYGQSPRIRLPRSKILGEGGGTTKNGRCQSVRLRCLRRGDTSSK